MCKGNWYMAKRKSTINLENRSEKNVCVYKK